MIHFGGCRDGFTSAGYLGGGAFTIALCDAWVNGQFEGSYRDLHDRILELIRREPQKPQYNEYGPVADSFRDERPFTIASAPPQSEHREVTATVRFKNGLATVELNTDFGLPKGASIPLARQGGCITVTEEGDGNEENGTTII